MKKLISCFLMIALLVSSLFVMTSCNNSKNEFDISKYYENAETCELNDKLNGLNIKFAYPKDKDFQTTFSDENSEFKKVTLNSEKINCSIIINFNKVSQNEISKRKAVCNKDPILYSNFKEIKYNGFNGCIFDYNDWPGTRKIGLLLLCEVEDEKSSEGWYGLEFSIEKASSSFDQVDFDATKYFDGEEFQNLLKSIQFIKEE